MRGNRIRRWRERERTDSDEYVRPCRSPRLTVFTSMELALVGQEDSMGQLVSDWVPPDFRGLG